MSLACRGHVFVENSISTRSAHFSTVFFHTCLKLGNRQSGQAVFAWGRDFHTLFHTLWKTGFCGFVAGCRTGVGYDIFCDFCIIGVVCLLGYLVNRVGLWGAGGVGGAVACRPCRFGIRWGACLPCRPLPLPLVFFSAPIPPTPFPAGRGGLKVFLCKGLRPLHPQGLTRTAQAFLVESGFRRGAQGGGRPPTLPCRNPAGGLPFWSPASPAFSFVSAPIPPPPFPAGRGRFKVYFAGGYRPRHPCNRVGCGTGFSCGK